MKKFALLIFVLVIIYIVANSQSPCLPEGITFTTQEEIDNFQTNYPGCTEIDGDFQICDFGSGNITNLNGLNIINSIGGFLWIHGNDALTSLTGLENLTSIGGNLMVYYNPVLDNLIGLENIDAGSISNLIIGGNELLSTCEVKSVCDYLTSPNGTITIENNAPGCNSPEEVEESCEALTQCLPEGITFTTQVEIDNFQTNYPGCTEIEGNVFIGDYQGMSDITNLNGLNVLTFVGGTLNILFNDVLTNLIGLSNVTSIGGGLGIGFNNSLTNLSGLDNLASIGGFLWIENNSSLTGLSELENITSIGGRLGIENNDNLTSLIGLENIDAGSIDSLYVIFNPILSVCDIQSICNYLAAPNGAIEIYDNAAGCDSPDEVEAACQTAIEENIKKYRITIIPNPSKDKISIISTPLTGNTQLSIFNVNGEKVLERQLTNTETQIDISALLRGVYFVRVWDEKIIEVMKLIKQ